MERDKLRDHALNMLANLESWVKYSDEARYRLFPEIDDIDDAFALTVLAWLRQQIRPEDGTLIMTHWTVEQAQQISEVSQAPAWLRQDEYPSEGSEARIYSLQEFGQLSEEEKSRIKPSQIKMEKQ